MVALIGIALIGSAIWFFPGLAKKTRRVLRPLGSVIICPAEIEHDPVDFACVSVFKAQQKMEFEKA